uniref:Protein pelota homolog n=1 Tax=Chromera velia CCMP2878 TaxID=1169474 RepID=A0A0G4HVR9_9ALVE|eukprot:Cvel_8905.t1-p1 / transcript=Cvel_8905.t1 / gene=Cvel_8905 / organism=Chromera_velia_CCMP2878 / gene_product=Protein pelota homolog, putative / transcript_product=Protein pelota homolog, putative / location=Cvel_scaffold501:48388-55546(+) / protein_length=421 / sequence_SO=supercontig / SO=protein_coding / is_pseudo=false
MKVLSKRVEGQNGSGTIEFESEEAEDLWHLYNIVSKGDCVRALTFRKVVREGVAGSTSSEMKKMVLTIQVKSVDYDARTDLLRFQGQNKSENPHVKLGQFHTIEFGLNHKMSVWKARWDSIFMDRVKEATDPKKSAEIAVLLIDAGIANLFLLTASLAKDVLKVEQAIPKRRGPFSNHDKAVVRFFGSVLNGLIQHVDTEVIKCVVVAGPGFTKDDFMTFVEKESQGKGGEKAPELLRKGLGMFVVAKASSAHRPALNELLSDPTVSSRIANTKASNQIRALERFYSTLANAPDKACYGPKHVRFAVERGAVEILMLADGLFRSAKTRERRNYVDLAETCKNTGAEVLIFSDMHVSGEQLKQLSGIAALLKYPLPELDELDDDGGNPGGARENVAQAEDEEDEGGGPQAPSDDLFGNFDPT